MNRTSGLIDSFRGGWREGFGWKGLVETGISLMFYGWIYVPMARWFGAEPSSPQMLGLSFVIMGFILGLLMAVRSAIWPHEKGRRGCVGGPDQPR